MGQGLAARITDPTAHGISAAPGPGSANVLIGSLRAWRSIDDSCVCPLPIAPPAPAPHGPEKCYLGSTTVLINNRMACRQTDILQGAGPPNLIAGGAATVIIGDAGFGLAAAAPMQRFAAAMAKLRKDWDGLTPAERKAAMQRALNDALSPGMPPLTLTATNLPLGTSGQLAFETWEVEIREELVSRPVSDEEFAELVETVYHESRHGEQWFNVAQARAGQGMSATRIAIDTGMPQHVTEAAVANAASPGTSEAAMGEAVDISVYGVRSAHRQAVYANTGADAYDLYRALPEEQDAWAQGAAVRALFGTLRP